MSKGLEVMDMEQIGSLESESLRAKTAYIKVTLGSRSQADLVQKKLKKVWLGDCLLRVKTQSDAKREHFNNRTIIIQNIPKHLTSDRALEVFGKEAGTIVGIELPRQNTKLKNLRFAIEEQDQTSEANVKKQEQYQRAKIAVQQSLDVDAEYQ